MWYNRACELQNRKMLLFFTPPDPPLFLFQWRETDKLSPNSCPKYFNQWFFLFYLKSFTACHTIYYLAIQVLLNSAAVFPDYWLSAGDFERRHVCYGTIAAGGGEGWGWRHGGQSTFWLLSFIMLRDCTIGRRIPRLIASRVLPTRSAGLFIRASVEAIGARPPARLDHLDSRGIIENRTTERCMHIVLVCRIGSHGVLKVSHPPGGCDL